MAAKSSPPPKQYGAICKLRPDKVEEFKEQHRTMWPEVSLPFTTPSLK